MTIPACPKCGSDAIIALYSMDVDMTVAWACLSCGHAWERFVEEDGHYYHRCHVAALAAMRAWCDDRGVR